MSTIDYLPIAAQDIADAQAWDDESIIIHLCAFIHRENLSEKLTDYLSEVAEEENAEIEAMFKNAKTL